MRAPNRFFRIALVLSSMMVIALAAGRWHATAADSANEDFGDSEVQTLNNDSLKSATGGKRLRENTMIVEMIGEFQVAGERIRFTPVNTERRLTVLENLALERVSRVLEETRTQRLWAVDGTITEFRGSNYLLITRAVLRAKS